MNDDNHRKMALIFMMAAALVFLPRAGMGADINTSTGAAARAIQVNNDEANIGDDVRLKIGDVDVHPHLGMAFTYDDNINISSGNNGAVKQGDFYAIVSPGVQFQYGKGDNALSLDYQAGIERFLRFTSNDTVDHMATLAGRFMVNNNLKLNISQGYSRSTGGESQNQNGLPEGQIGERIPGTRVEIENYTTALGAEYAISEKTSIGANFNMTFMNYINPPGLIGSDAYDLRIPFYYHVSEKTDVFTYGDVGTTTVDQGANQTQEGVGIGARTRLTGKINGSASVGYQHFDYNGGGIPSVNTVVATVNGTWVITPRTSLSASINRGEQPTAQAVNNYYENTTVNLTLSQKAWHDKVTFSVGGGYELDEYGQPFSTGVGTGATGTRSDSYYYLLVQGDYMIRKWWSAGAYYRYRSNGSSLSAYQFDDNMVSIYTRVSF